MIYAAPPGEVLSGGRGARRNADNSAGVMPVGTNRAAPKTRTKRNYTSDCRESSGDDRWEADK